MDYKEKYNTALEMARKAYYSPETPHVAKAWLLTMFPTLVENENEKIRRNIIELVKQSSEVLNKQNQKEMLVWLEKQSHKIVDCPQNHQDVKHPNGGIVMEDFNGGEGFYKLHLDYLSKKQVEEVEEMVRTWNKESKTSDENIRNCIGMCLTDANEQRFKDYGTTLKDCLAWIEKQGQQTVTDKTKSKFNSGDYIVPDNDAFLEIWRVINIDIDDYYNIQCITNSEYDEIYRIPGFVLENDYHLWTIADAKNGDVLATDNGNCPFIYRTKTIFGNPVAYCGVRSDGLFISESPENHQWCLKNEVIPATKEQCDLLFQKMKEAGWEWDSKNKELKKNLLNNLNK